MDDKELIRLREKMAGTPIVVQPRQLVCSYYEENGGTTSVCIDLDKDDHILVTFEKGYVVVSNGKETKFVCKGKAFISLWN